MKVFKIAFLSSVLALSPLTVADDGGSQEREHSSAASVPELDVGAAGAALGLVVAVTALIRARRKTR